MQNLKKTGWLFIISALLLFVPYTLLAVQFDYPQILRADVGVILARFRAGGTSLILVWWSFAAVGVPLLWAIMGLGQYLEKQLPGLRVATYLGAAAILVQLIGLLRWTFVVPVLANLYTAPQASAGTKEAVGVVFTMVHQYGGVLLGEHLGQLGSIAWTVMVCAAFLRLGLFPRWLAWFGYAAAVVYLLAQAELFATVIPHFPVWGPAGLLGSTLWLVWLILVGAGLLRHTPRRVDYSIATHS